jgi:hypothetical protein
MTIKLSSEVLKAIEAATQSTKPAPRFVKGSPEAKAHMAALRAKRGKAKAEPKVAAPAPKAEGLGQVLATQDGVTLWFDGQIFSMTHPSWKRITKISSHKAGRLVALLGAAGRI